MLSLTARLGRHAAWVGGAAALAGAASFPLGQAHLSAAPSSEPLSPDEWRSLKVLAREGLTQGERPTILLRFGLPPNHPPLPVASCLLVSQGCPLQLCRTDGSTSLPQRESLPRLHQLVPYFLMQVRAPVGKVKDDGSRAFVLRPYTPVSAPDADTLDLALKIYPGGALTPYLGGLKPGDVLEFKGPLPKARAKKNKTKKKLFPLPCMGSRTSQFRASPKYFHPRALDRQHPVARPTTAKFKHTHSICHPLGSPLSKNLTCSCL